LIQTFLSISVFLNRHETPPYKNVDQMLSFYSLFLKLRDLPFPTLASIHGPAVGAGLGVALACDVRVVGKKAKLGTPFSKLGIHPGMGISHLLPRIVGMEKATRLLLSSEPITGQEAWEGGLASEMVEEADQVLEKTIQIAR